MNELTLRRAGLAWGGVLLAAAGTLAVMVNAQALVLSNSILLALAQVPGGTVLDGVMFTLSLLGSIEVTIVVLLAVTLLSGSPWRSWQRWLPLAMFVVLDLVELASKQLVLSPSPPASLVRGPHFGIGLILTGSFPSGHMVRATLLYGIIALRGFSRTRHLRWLVGLTILLWVVGFSRVYLAHHWPADVAGGILLGGGGLGLLVAAAPSEVCVGARGPTS